MVRGLWNKRTDEEIKEIIEDLGYELLDEYPDEKSNRKVIIRDSDGYRYEVYLNNLLTGSVPSIAETRNPFTLPNISLWLKKENKPFILCEDNVYKGALEKLFFRCIREDCQETFDMRWSDIYSDGNGCPFCGGYRVGKRNNLTYRRPDLVKEWDHKNNEKNPNEYTEKSGKKVSWVCLKCGNTWKTEIYHRSNGNGCPKCADTRKESKIANFLKEYLNINYNSISEYKIFKNPKTGYWLPYDIYIPNGENKELNGFYIEVHSDQHYKLCAWHKRQSNNKGTTPEEEFEYQKHLDRIKRRFARKNGTYIEIDLRKIKTVEEAIEYIENIIKKTLS